MTALNKIILIGRLTADPDVKVTNDGIPFAKFTLAVDRPVRPESEKKTDFINTTAWRNIADIVKNHCTKGKLILIEGRIRTGSFETDKGIRKWTTEVDATNIRFIEPKDKTDIQSQETAFEPPKASVLEEKETEILKESEFNFNEKGTDNQLEDIQFPPQFGEEVEAEIPF